MDTMRDFAPFREEIDKLCATFDRPPAKDELVDAYWNSLRDTQLSEIRRNVARIIRTATRDTKWPKPGDLRDAVPEEGTRRSAAHEAAYRSAEERSARNWEEQRRLDPELAEVELGIAKCGRILAADDPSTPQHAEALAMDRQYRDQRKALLERRSAK
jgi:hypothetical protein